LLARNRSDGNGKNHTRLIGCRATAAKLAESCFDAANHKKIRAFTRKTLREEAMCSVPARSSRAHLRASHEISL
jgi:hypothetical protein|tara:strand:- start:869 stop:1090 length:222 start_codon:yes stop_codon:yes gene_type:complete